MAALLCCQAAVSETTPGSRRIRQGEMVAREGWEVHDWICMLKHNSQTAMSRVGRDWELERMKNNEDQHEKDWKEPPEASSGVAVGRRKGTSKFILTCIRWPGGGVGRGRHDKMECWAPPQPDFSKLLPSPQLRGKH